MYLGQLIYFAYPEAYSIHGIPTWAAIPRGVAYAVDAKPPAASPSPTTEQVRLMMRALLESRFHRRVHFGSQSGPVYFLVVGKGGPKGMTPAKSNERPNTISLVTEWTTAALSARATSMRSIAIFFSDLLHTPIIDHTGLAGNYTIDLPVLPDPTPPPGSLRPSDASVLIGVLHNRLGLDLQRGTDMGFTEATSNLGPAFDWAAAATVAPHNSKSAHWASTRGGAVIFRTCSIVALPSTLSSHQMHRLPGFRADRRRDAKKGR